MAEKSGMKKCEMPGCLCQVAPEEKYCSSYCESAKDSTKLECDCGHPACVRQKL